MDAEIYMHLEISMMLGLVMLAGLFNILIKSLARQLYYNRRIYELLQANGRNGR